MKLLNFFTRNKTYSTIVFIFIIGIILTAYSFSFKAKNSLMANELSDSQNETKEDFTPLIFELEKKLDNSFKYHIIESDTIFNPHAFVSFSESYAHDTLSIFNFRGGAERCTPSRGVIDAPPTSLSLLWQFKTNVDTVKTDFGVWGGGAGWTGQPLLINWNKEQKAKLCITDTSFIEDANAMELIIGSLSGEIYFINAQTGNATRPPLTINSPIKGTVSVDPRKNGLLYVGQGIRTNSNRFGVYIFDMFTGQEIHYLSGFDKHAPRSWGAFDSNPLIEQHTGTVFWPSENGLIYKFNVDSNKRIHHLTKLNYKHNKMRRYGLEASMAAIGNLGFFADNSGTVMCIDLRNMTPLWHIDNYDDTDATIVIDKENDNSYFLYVGNEVDHNGPVSKSSFRKLDAFTGKEIWKVERECYGTKINDNDNSGGILSTPLTGKNNCDSIVYCIFSRVDKANRSELLAINKYTGITNYTLFLNQYTWASPVDIYDKNGNMYLFFTDVGGGLYLINGKTGELIFKEKISATIESSPVAFNNKIYFATRGNRILCYELITE